MLNNIKRFTNSKLFVFSIFVIAIAAVNLAYYSLDKFGPLEWIGISLINGYLIFVGISVIVNGHKSDEK